VEFGFSPYRKSGYQYQHAKIAPCSSWRFCQTLSAVSQITQFHFPLCPVLENGVRKRHEKKNSKELPTRQMVFDSPPDEKSSPNENHNPIHEMDDDRKPRPTARMVPVRGPPLNRSAAFSVHVSEYWKHRCQATLPLPHLGILFRNFVNQIYVAVKAAGKSRTVFGSALGAEHDQNHIPHAIPVVSA